MDSGTDSELFHVSVQKARLPMAERSIIAVISSYVKLCYRQWPYCGSENGL